MRDSLTELIIILDTSGSMENIEKDMIGALNGLLDDQRKEPGEIRVTYTRFNTNVEEVCSGRNISEIQRIDFRSAGGTALYDAVAFTVNNVGRRLAATPESDRPAKVICVIVTDGGENSSREYSKYYGGAAKVKQIIEHQREKYNWVFTFLGADQDAIVAGAEIGINSSHSANFVKTGAAVGNARQTLSNKVSGIRGMSAMAYNAVNHCDLYTSAERDSMEDKQATPETIVSVPETPKRRSRSKA